MKPTGIIILVLFALIMAPSPAPAAGYSVFNDMDTDKDGKITKQELSTRVKDKKSLDQAHQALDKDGDGVLTEKDARIMFNEMDANHDGKVSKKEYDDYYSRWQKKLEAPVNDLAPRARDFDDLDKNRDGYADFDEHFTRWPILLPQWR